MKRQDGNVSVTEPEGAGVEVREPAEVDLPKAASDAERTAATAEQADPPGAKRSAYRLVTACSVDVRPDSKKGG